MKNVLFLFAFFCLTAAGSTLPSATKVATPPKVAKPGVSQETLFLFSELYKANASPRLTIFWNRSFDDQLSEWVNRSPLSVATDAVTLDSQKNSLHIKQRPTSSTLVQQLNKQRESPSEEKFETLKSAFLQPFLKAKTTFVDRNIIMRLIAEAETELHQPTLLDAKQIETKALQAKTDYIMQILFIPTEQSKLGFNVLVEVFNVTSGALVVSVMHKEQTASTAWLATDNGFTQVLKHPEPLTFDVLGIELAESTMSALINFWRDKNAVN